MTRNIIAAALLALAGTALAIEIEVEWEYPTEWVNDEAINEGSLGQVELYVDGELAGTAEYPDTFMVVTVESCVDAEITARVSSVDGLWSELSEPFTVGVCQPKPPRISGIKVR